jgi:formylglycine-generating enzyme required for sulfatase activity
MKLAYVPAGEFVMGSPAAEAGRHDDETQHRVRISRPFYLGVTEVTQAQWVALGGAVRSQAKADNLPVAKVSWSDAVAFCRKLSQKEGHRYRLATEAEWEYACRAGAAGPFAGTCKADEMAWHMDNSDDQPHAVGAKKPNAWGLYDMHGNVMEWCSDWYAPAPSSSAATDPAGPEQGKYRVARGGSYGHFARACRSAARASFNPAYQLDQLGLRVAMDIDPNDPRR